MRRLIFYLFLFIVFLSGKTSFAQTEARVEAPLKTAEVFVSQGFLITFPGPAETIFIAEPEIASYQVVNKNKIVLFGRLPGQTSLMAMNSDGEAIYSLTVVVRYDTTQMAAALKREFPSLMLRLTPAQDGIAVSGNVPTPQIASDVIALLDSFVQLGRPSAMASTISSTSTGESRSSQDGESEQTGPAAGRGTMAARYGKIINRLTVTMPTQVTIRIRVAEVNRNLSEQLGIKWFYNRSGNIGNNNFLFGLADSTLASTTLGDMFPGSAQADFAGLIDALAEEQLVSILAEPNLTVMSGESASFLAGGQIPFPSISQEGNVSIEFRDFGVLLGVTPTILSPDRVSLRVRPEVSEPSDANGININGTIVPGFVVRRAETTIELASGQSFAIGGLLQSNLINNVYKIPFLGDIPILGALARSTSFKRGETELVIIATAYIAEPAGGNLRIPNADVIIPNAFNRLFLGSKPKVAPGPIQPNDFMFF